MNEEIKDKMIEYFKQLETVAKTASDFSSEQFPLLIQEYISWLFWSHSFLAIVSILAVVLLCWFLQFGSKQFEETPDVALFLSVLSVGAIIICFVLSITNLYEVVKITVAPRVVVIEKLSDLVNGEK